MKEADLVEFTIFLNCTIIVIDSLPCGPEGPGLPSAHDGPRGPVKIIKS